jgi:integrase
MSAVLQPDASPGDGRLPQLPPLVRTKGGATFDPRLPIWSYRDGANKISLNFAFEAALVPEVGRALRATLTWYAENHSPSHLNNTHAAIKKFVGLVVKTRPGELINQIDGTEILSHRNSMPHALKRLAALVKKWHALGYPGVADSAVAVFNDITIKGNKTGEAVLTRDPITGPFTDIERAGIEDALNAAYADGTLPEEHFLLAWLFMAIGARPVQFAAMKVCDVLSESGDDGHVQFFVRVPRAKQRANLRSEFRDRPLTPQIGRPLLEYALRVRQRFSGLLHDIDQAPLFPEARLGVKAQRAANEAAAWSDYHRTAEHLGVTLSEALGKLQIRSERTGELMRLNPRRFRYTFGTNAAREGHGLLVIAELLDHAGTESAGVYVAAAPEIAARIERATALQLAPLAQAFKGILVSGESEASRAGDPSSRIIDLRIDRNAKPMGSCGQHGFCGFLAPIACYTCQNFEPWLDGPHESVLDFMLAERDRHVGDSRVAGVNDRTILAVAEVVQLCRNIKDGGSNGTGAEARG